MYHGGEVRLMAGKTIFCASSEWCCWTYSEPEVMTSELYNLVVIQVQVQVAP